MSKVKKILSITRKSKYLLIKLNNSYTILVHLGMTGKIFILKGNKTKKTSFYFDNNFKKKHNHFCFEFDQSCKLIYNDVRKFGFIKIFKSNEIYKCNHLRLLGPDPLSKKFKKNYLFETALK